MIIHPYNGLPQGPHSTAQREQARPRLSNSPSGRCWRRQSCPGWGRPLCRPPRHPGQPSGGPGHPDPVGCRDQPQEQRWKDTIGPSQAWWPWGIGKLRIGQMQLTDPSTRWVFFRGHTSFSGPSKEEKPLSGKIQSESPENFWLIIYPRARKEGNKAVVRLLLAASGQVSYIPLYLFNSSPNLFMWNEVLSWWICPVKLFPGHFIGWNYCKIRPSVLRQKINQVSSILVGER